VYKSAPGRRVASLERKYHLEAFGHEEMASLGARRTARASLEEMASFGARRAA
jgi:hypothetical protein